MFDAWFYRSSTLYLNSCFPWGDTLPICIQFISHLHPITNNPSILCILEAQPCQQLAEFQIDYSNNQDGGPPTHLHLTFCWSLFFDLMDSKQLLHPISWSTLSPFPSSPLHLPCSQQPFHPLLAQMCTLGQIRSLSLTPFLPTHCNSVPQSRLQQLPPLSLCLSVLDV